MASQEDLAFGQIAVEKKFCTAAQVAECLEQQAKERELGVLPKSLAETLMQAGHLSQYLVKEIYKLQGKQEGFPKIEGYVIEAKIGHGGMGTVYRAVQQSLERPVAIKVLSSNLARDREFVKRFMREARAVASLNHENIIVGIDVGKSNDHHFFAMEYVDGFTVHDMLRMDGPLDEAKALAIVRQMALALAHANEHHLVHRDVKPGNIMVVADGTAKLCDLGLAKSIHQDNHLTHTGTTHGTPHYMSPEQARGSHDIDIRSDIYSLGATLYQMVVGEVPFTGASAAVVLLKHLSETVPSPRHRRPNLSDGVCHLIEKMMAKKAEHRYQTPRELLADIDRVAAGEAPLADRPKLGQSSVMPASAPPDAATSITDTPPDVAFDHGGAAREAPADLRPRLLIAVACVLAGALITLFVVQGGGRKDAGRHGGPNATAVSVDPAATARVPAPAPPSPPPGPSPAEAALEQQAAEWFTELQRNLARYPADHREHLAACDALLERFPGTLAAQKARGVRSDVKARWHETARAALDRALAAQDKLLLEDEVGEAIVQLKEVEEQYRGTPAATEAESRLQKMYELQVVRLADIRQAASEAESEGDGEAGGDYATAIAHWKRALKLGDTDITAEAKLQIERLEGLRRFAEAAAAKRAAQEARTHLHNHLAAAFQTTLAGRRYRASLEALDAFAATPEAAPLEARLGRERALVEQAAETFEAAEQALAERIGSAVALRKRGVTDSLIAGQLKRFDGGTLRVQLSGTAGAVVSLESRDLAVEDLLRLAGAPKDTAEGRWAEAALRYCDGDLPGTRSALAAADEAGMQVGSARADLDEHVAWRLLQAARRHWIADRYREAGETLEQLRRRYRATELFADHDEEITGRAALAPLYEERAEAVRLLGGEGAEKVFGGQAEVAADQAPSGPPHLQLRLQPLEFGPKGQPAWFLLEGELEAKPWGGGPEGIAGAPGTSLVYEPRLHGDAPIRVRLRFQASAAPSGTILALGEPLVAGAGKEHLPVRVIVADGGAVVVVREQPFNGDPSDLLRIDGLKLADGGTHAIDVKLGEGRISVAIDDLPPRTAAAGSRKGGHVKLDGHGPKLRFRGIQIEGRLDPRWVLNDRKVRRLLTARDR